MEQYLASATTSVQCLELDHVKFNRHSGTDKILAGLTRNSSPKALAFTDCAITPTVLKNDRNAFEEEEDEISEQELAQQLANCLQCMVKLTALSVSGCDTFFYFEKFVEKFQGDLVQGRSSLQYLDLAIWSVFVGATYP